MCVFDLGSSACWFIDPSVRAKDDEEGDSRGACVLRLDGAQGGRDGDVIGAGIYNNKCWVPGCR